jgi:hypothetical protein
MQLDLPGPQIIIEAYNRRGLGNPLGLSRDNIKHQMIKIRCKKIRKEILMIIAKLYNNWYIFFLKKFFSAGTLALDFGRGIQSFAEQFVHPILPYWGIIRFRRPMLGIMFTLTKQRKCCTRVKTEKAVQLYI